MRKKLTSRVFVPALAAVICLLAGLGLGAKQGAFWTDGSDLPASSRVDVGPKSMAPLAKKTMPGVVTVYTKRKAVGYFFFAPVPYVQEGSGSGFIISSDGYIVTNNHVVADSTSIKVVVGVEEKDEYDARLVGKDPDTDVALIKIEADNLPVLPLGDSEAIEVGDWVAAIGSPFNFAHTFTVGVVSAKGRRLGVGNYDDFIQTDASINSGNSGGPLVNMRGEVVGVNTIIVSPSGGNVGIAFAIPINLVKAVLPQIRETGKVTRSWLGVSVDDVSKELADRIGLDSPSGAHVVRLVVDGPADRAGIEVNDVIVDFNGRRIEDSGDLPMAVSAFGVGRQAEITWIRDGKKMTRTIELEAMPSGREMASYEVKGQASTDNILGLGVTDLSEDEVRGSGGIYGGGVKVAEVKPGSLGQRYGLSPGDVILKINRYEINDVDDFEKAVSKIDPGSFVKITARRGGMIMKKSFSVPR